MARRSRAGMAGQLLLANELLAFRHGRNSRTRGNRIATAGDIRLLTARAARSGRRERGRQPESGYTRVGRERIEILVQPADVAGVGRAVEPAHAQLEVRRNEFRRDVLQSDQPGLLTEFQASAGAGLELLEGS